MKIEIYCNSLLSIFTLGIYTLLDYIIPNGIKEKPVKVLVDLLIYFIVYYFRNLCYLLAICGW